MELGLWDSVLDSSPDHMGHWLVTWSHPLSALSLDVFNCKMWTRTAALGCSEGHGGGRTKGQSLISLRVRVKPEGGSSLNLGLLWGAGFFLGGVDKRVTL